MFRGNHLVAVLLQVVTNVATLVV